MARGAAAAVHSPVVPITGPGRAGSDSSRPCHDLGEASLVQKPRRDEAEAGQRVGRSTGVDDAAEYLIDASCACRTRDGVHTAVAETLTKCGEYHMLTVPAVRFGRIEVSAREFRFQRRSQALLALLG